jgi:hypothetical protein
LLPLTRTVHQGIEKVQSFSKKIKLIVSLADETCSNCQCHNQIVSPPSGVKGEALAYIVFNNMISELETLFVG